MLYDPVAPFKCHLTSAAPDVAPDDVVEVPPMVRRENATGLCS